MEMVKMQPNIEQNTDKWQEMVDTESWPLPNWYNESHKKLRKNNLDNYAAFSVHRLRTRYMELESEFRTIFGNYHSVGHLDLATAECIVDLLRMAKKSLEDKAPDLLAVSSTLDSVARYMVWLYPSHMAIPRTVSVLSRLESLDTPSKDQITDLLTGASEKVIDNFKDMTALERLRGALDEAIGTIQEFTIQEQIKNGLQIERLKTLRLWGIVTFVVFLIASPLATNLETLAGWPSQLVVREPPIFTAWITSLGIAVIGAAGGFLSGLLKMRSSRVTLPAYQENMLKLQLKPLIGALASLILFILLSWQILPGIRIENAGSYFLIALLSGFSERCFLKLLELENSDKSPDKETGPSKPENDLSKRYFLRLLERETESQSARN